MMSDVFDVLIVYASQTGSAEAIAQELADDLRSVFFVSPRVTCASKLRPESELSDGTVVVFVVSTTGDGEPPDTALQLWKTLRHRTETYMTLSYTILGLGDTNYSHFNQFAKDLHRRLQTLQASCFLDVGYADDALGLENVVEPWKKTLYAHLTNSVAAQTVSSTSSLTSRAMSVAGIVADTTTPHYDGTRKQAQSHVDGTLSHECDVCGGLLPAFSVSIGGQGADPKAVSPTGGSEVYKQDKRPSIDSGCSCELDSHPFTDTEQTLSRKAVEILHMLGVDKPEGTSFRPHKTVPPWLDVELRPSTPNDGPSEGEKEESYPHEYSPHWCGAGLEAAHTVRVLDVKRLTNQKAVKNVDAISLDLTGTPLKYEPGDAFGVLARNSDREIDSLVKALGVSASLDSAVLLRLRNDTSRRDLPVHLLGCQTMRMCLQHHVDIRKIPRQGFLRVLADHTEDADEKKALLYLSSPEGRSDLESVKRSAKHRLSDIVSVCNSLELPPGRLLEGLYALLPRYYSAASSPIASPETLRFAFSLVRFSKYGTANDTGVCTGWLDGMLKSDTQPAITGQTIRIFRKPSPHFRLPVDRKAPLILIGAGTGVSPFIGFLQHRAHQNRTAKATQHNHTRQLGNAAQRQRHEPAHRQLNDRIKAEEVPNFIWLFYGCRNALQDAIFEEELDAALTNGTLTRLNVSYSRDRCNPSVKYVQDNILAYGADIMDLMDRHGAYIYVCGDGKHMAAAVEDALRAAVCDYRQCDNDSARDAVSQWEHKGRFKRDVWS